MNNWFKRNTKTKEDREQFVLMVSLGLLFIPAILGGIVLLIVAAVQNPHVSAPIVAGITGAVLGNWLLDKWIKRGE